MHLVTLFAFTFIQLLSSPRPTSRENVSEIRLELFLFIYLLTNKQTTTKHELHFGRKKSQIHQMPYDFPEFSTIIVGPFSLVQ